MDEYSITNCKLVITWNDGRSEDLAPDLPEYLAEQLEQYFDDLEDLRNEQQDEYNFGDEA